MKFYYPELLFRLFLIAIPVIIHLFNFRKFKKVYFSNTRLLKEIKIQTSSRQKIKERLILLMRILTVAFLVFAFAKPYIPNKENQNLHGDNIISIYIDNSYSMDAVGENGSLLDEAKKKAVEIIQAFGLNDKFHLVSNELSGTQSKLLNREEFIALLDSVQINAKPNNFYDIIHAQQRFLADYTDAAKYAFIISDFQKSVDNQKIKLDSTINYRLLSISPNKTANIAVDSVWFLSPLHQPNADEKLVVRLKNYSTVAVENVPISLSIDGKLKTIGNVRVEADASSLDTLSFSGLQAGWQKAEVSINDHPVIFDNKYYFSFEVKQNLTVTVLNREKKENYFTFLFATDSYFNVTNISESEINYTTLNDQRFIVLNDLKRVSEGLSQQLSLYVENGGNLSVFLPIDADLESYRNFLQRLGADIPLALRKDTIKVDKLNLSHPMFSDLFEKQPSNIDLPRSSNYFAFSRNTKTTGVTLMSEGNLPLLINYKKGKGNVYISALPIEKEVSNFASHGLFLPILFKMAMLTSNAEKLQYTVGGHEGILLSAKSIAASEILQLKGNNKEIIPEIRNTHLGTTVFLADQIKQAGFYNLYNKGKLLQVLAFNDSRTESIRDFYTESELKEKFGLGASEIISNSKVSVTNQIKEVNSGISFWKLCLILALIFLAIEILLLRFYSVTKN